MAERPCGCGVPWLRPNSSLCSCRQLLYVRPALDRTCSRREVGAFRRGWVTVGEYFRGKGASPTNRCWCQKTRLIALSCGIKTSAVHDLVLSQYTHLTVGQTDWRTELRQQYRALHYMQSARQKWCVTRKVVSSEIYFNLSRNFRKFINCLWQSAVSKSSIAKWCCKINTLLTNNSPDFYALTSCIILTENILILTRF